MESKDQTDVVEESESCASSTTATLEYDDVTSRGKIVLNKRNALAVIANAPYQSLLVNASFKLCRSACSVVS